MFFLIVIREVRVSFLIDWGISHLKHDSLKMVYLKYIFCKKSMIDIQEHMLRDEEIYSVWEDAVLQKDTEYFIDWTCG